MSTESLSAVAIVFGVGLGNGFYELRSRQTFPLLDPDSRSDSD
jgi:hypothetical protein